MAGDSLSLPRSIDFSVVFPSQQAAFAFCDEIVESGLTLAMEGWLAIEAEAFGGENDGWGCFNMNDLPKS